jgi:RNA polymerase sigma factor (sigma-70 family)
MSEAAIPPGSRLGLGRMLSDERLARRAVDGDERAFAAIYRRYHQDLYRFCLAIVGNQQDAQDALQNTMVKVLRALPGEERSLELKPWLYRIAHNESIELLRRRKGTEALDSELAGRGPALAEEAALRERLRHLISDLDELPERQRGALVMRELGGLDFDGIGAALGTSAAVARQTVYEARLGLREMDAGREMSCASVTRAISDGDGRVLRRRDVRAHLRSCSECRRFRDEIGSRGRDLAAISPLPAAAAAGLLHGVLGGSGGSGGGLVGALGGGAVKSLGASVALKSAATVAVVAAIGTAAADRGGLIDAGLPGGGGVQEQQSQESGDAVEGGSAPGGGSAGGPANGANAQRGGGSGSSGDAQAGTGSDAGGSGSGAGGAGAASAGGSHPHGRGHAKSHPAASAHGQETAASHHASKHGGGHSHPSHPEHPVKPAHPAQPPKPSSERSPSSPPDPSGTEHGPHSPSTSAQPPEEEPPAGEAPEAGE